MQTTNQHQSAPSRSLSSKAVWQCETALLVNMSLCFSQLMALHIVSPIALSFRSLVETIRHTNAAPPSRTAIKHSLSTLADKLRNTILQQLISSSAPVTVAIDGWTNVNHTKITNLVLICNGVAYYWCSIPNDFDKNTAVWLNSVISPVLTNLHARGIRFSSLVALFELLQQSFPFLIRIPCAAHTVQIVVKGVLAIVKFSKTVDVVRSIVNQFEKQKDSRLRLRTLQQGADSRGSQHNRGCCSLCHRHPRHRRRHGQAHRRTSR